jgi:two-component system, NtrC family, response regulator HydG
MEDDEMNASELTGREMTSRGGEEKDVTNVMDPVEMLQAAQTDACLLFTGFANARSLGLRIHRLSRWRWSPFVAVDCGWPEPLLTELLFGVRAANLQAADAPKPKSRLLGSGTIFLQEVGKLGWDLQIRFLDILGRTSTLGGPRSSRKRVMASTSEVLWQRVVDGTFNDRLFYRLNAIHFVQPTERSHG